MSKCHTVVADDTLPRIAVRYYGKGERWTDIVKSNPQLVGRRTTSDGFPVIRSGDMLLIQGYDEGFSANKGETVVLDANAKRDITLFVDGKKFTGFTAFTIDSPVDSFDAFSFSAAWDSSNVFVRNAFRPFSYKRCELRYDEEVLFRGVMLPSVPQISPESKTIGVQGYPLCGVLSDSCIPDSIYPPQFDGLTLKQIADTVCEPFGVSVRMNDDGGAAFEKVGIEAGEKVFDFLKKLAEQRGLFLSNTSDGALLIWKPKTEVVSASFKEGEAPFVSCVPSFDGQNMFSHLTGFTKVSRLKESEKYTYENNYLIKNGVLRQHTVTIDDAESDTLESSVKALAGRMYASAVKYTLTVTGHRDKNGRLYRKNMTVSLFAPDAEVYRDTKLQVDSVQLSRSDSDGDIAVLSLVLPGARTGQLPEVFPWEE